MGEACLTPGEFGVVGLVWGVDAFSDTRRCPAGLDEVPRVSIPRKTSSV
jgi:hypothetical protein